MARTATSPLRSTLNLIPRRPSALAKSKPYLLLVLPSLSIRAEAGVQQVDHGIYKLTSILAQV